MFDFLKRKISAFTERVGERIGKKEADAAPLPSESRRENPEADTRQLTAKLSAGSRLKGIVAGKITIEQKDIEGFLEEFELALLEADVEQDTAREIIQLMEKELVGSRIESGRDVSAYLRERIRGILVQIMKTEERDFLSEIGKKKPYVILMLGPNGAGKTTTIAKLTHMLQGAGKSCIWAASDTFRAASIEQLEEHAARLGVRVVKHHYGADPAAVAFDAVRAAEARHLDVVLIDSAGRQETNRNLMEELRKINRVAKADMRIYVGEAFTGQALLQQAGEFDAAVSIDGFILTKIDADAKGGTAISLLYKLKKPIFFIGTGQEYGALQHFTPHYIIDRVIA